MEMIKRRYKTTFIGIAFIVVFWIFFENQNRKQLLLKVVIHLEFWTTHNYI
jgi:hypothetical protein